MKNAWIFWAVGEGVIRTGSRTLQKLLGLVSRTLPGAVISILVVGLVQCFGGWVYARAYDRPLYLSRRQLGASIVFGLIATAMSVLGVWIFTFPGSDQGVVTFLFTLSIVPGALVDRAFFKHRLTGRQWLAVIVFVASGYAMLNFPNLYELAHLPAWAVLSLVMALLSVANEALAQLMAEHGDKKRDPLVNNFWIGLTTFVSCTAVVWFFNLWPLMLELPRLFFVASGFIGLLVVGLIIFNLQAYRAGGIIASKKYVMQSTYLLLAIVLGFLFYQETLTIGKILGLAGFLIAYPLMVKPQSQTANAVSEASK